MDYIIDYARKAGLERLEGFLVEQRRVHGIAVTIDPFWLYCWKIYWNSNKNSDPGFWNTIIENFSYLRRRFFYFNEFSNSLNNDWWEEQYFPTAIADIDLGWRPPFWENYIKKDPVIVKIHLEPGSDPINLEQFLQLTENRLEIVQETRPVATMSASASDMQRPLIGGLSIGQGRKSAGTLGGILKDKTTGKLYAVSCGHVIPQAGKYVEQPSLMDNSKQASVIGTCKLSAFPVPSKNKFCSLFEDSGPRDMDLSLVELNKDINANQEIAGIGSIEGYMPNKKLVPGLEVEMAGRTSGYSRLLLGDAIIVKKIKMDGQTYCFKRLMQVRHRRLLSLFLSRPVSKGDSGAWVCAQGVSGTEWCGMIIAEDRLCGYAISSEDILVWLENNKFKLSL